MITTFIVLEDHLKLLENAYVSWENCEFGAPSIDCKRPYGNSSVYCDIAKILNIFPNEDTDEYSTEQYKYMGKIHQETETVLQIVLHTRKMEVGSYQQIDYGKWEKL